VSDLSNVTPRYLGSEQKGRFLLLGLTFNSRLASLLLRWKAADTVFVVLSFRFQVWRYPSTVAMSFTSTPLLNTPTGEGDRCLHVALPVAAFPEMLTKSVITRATTATRAGCVQRGMSQATPFSGRGSSAAEMLPKTTHDPTYSS